MKINRQIQFDKYVGLPLGILLNGIVRLFGMILRINHDLDREFKRIAVVKYKGMGSIIQAVPMLRTLKQRFPDSKIIFITSVQNKALIDLLDAVDEGIYLDDRNLATSLIDLPGYLISMWKYRFQLLFDLELYSNFSSIFSTFSLATNRFGFYLSSSQYRMGLYTHMMFFNIKSPLSHTYLQMVRFLDIEPKEDAFSPFRLEQIPQDVHGVQKPYMVINVNASELRIERRWKQSSFAALTDRLHEKYPKHQFVFTGSKVEDPYVKEVLNQLSHWDERIISLAGKTDLRSLIELISGAEIMITCDTGPAHLAYIQNTKTVALFGPVSPMQFNIPDNVGVVYKNIYCSPCIHEFDIPPCKGDNQCMKLISVDEVMQMVETVLKPGFKRTESWSKLTYTGVDGEVLGQVFR